MMWLWMTVVVVLSILLGFAACALLTVSKVTEMEDQASRILAHLGVRNQGEADQILEYLEEQERRSHE